MANDACKVGARKNIQAKQTKLNTAKRVNQRKSIDRGVRTPNFRSAASTPPCNPPQRTKFQLAPCQRPPMNMVSRMLM